MKTIKAEQVSNLRMVAGNENHFRHVIDNGILKEWVGIGWIELRKATDKDREKYPEVVRDD